jgi:hypothetical protein
MGFQALQCLPAIQFGHIQVQDDQLGQVIGRQCFQVRQYFGPIFQKENGKLGIHRFAGFFDGRPVVRIIIGV